MNYLGNKKKRYNCISRRFIGKLYLKICSGGIAMIEPDFVVPMAFFKEDKYKDLNHTSLLLYGVLVELHKHAIQINQLDETGTPYILCTNKTLSNFLGVSNEKFVKCKRELTEVGLLSQVRQGLSKPNKLYLTLIETECQKV